MMPSTSSPHWRRIVSDSSPTLSGCSRLVMRITSWRIDAIVELRPRPISSATMRATPTSWFIIGVPSYRVYGCIFSPANASALSTICCVRSENCDAIIRLNSAYLSMSLSL